MRVYRGRKIYSQCNENGVRVNYADSENDFVISFSRINGNIMTGDGIISDTLSENESEILEYLRRNKDFTATEIDEMSGKSLRTIREKSK